MTKDTYIPIVVSIKLVLVCPINMSPQKRFSGLIIKNQRIGIIRRCRLKTKSTEYLDNYQDKETFQLAYFKILKEAIFAILIWKIQQIVESSGKELTLTLAIKG